MRKQCSVKPSCFKSFAVLVSLVVGGCAIAPTPISQSDQAALAMVDKAAAARDVEPLNAHLTLSEALARGLKYNLNHRTRMMEQALAMGQWDMSRYDMLPKLMAGAGYNWRNNERVTNSKDSVTGLPSLANPFITSERIHTVTDLGLTWNLLDFGVSYQAAKQNADRVLVAGEYRRKSMHLLMQDITTVYWRAVSAQKIDHILRDTIRQAEAALADSQKAENEKLRDPIEALRYQRTILENLRILESIKREMATAKTELAALINLPLSVNYELADPTSEELSPQHATMPIEKMEEIAVRNNAELRAEFYNSRIAVAEAKKSIMKLFPGISFNYTRKHDSDDYLINKSWREAGAQISWNLFNLLSMPATLRYAEANKKLGEQRRLTAQMAVLAQVHISRQQYDSAFALFKRADAIWRVDERIYTHTKSRESASVKSQLDRVLNGTSAVVSLLRRYQALSDVYAASSTVKATLGVDPHIDDVQATSLQVLANHLQTNLVTSSWDEPQTAVAVVHTEQLPFKQSEKITTGTFAEQQPIKAPIAKTSAIKETHPVMIHRPVVAVPATVQVNTKSAKQLAGKPKTTIDRTNRTNDEILAQDKARLQRRVLNKNNVETKISTAPEMVKNGKTAAAATPQPVSMVSEQPNKGQVQTEVKPVASTSKPGDIVSEKPIEQQPIKVKHGISQKVRVLTPAQVEAQAKSAIKAPTKQQGQVQTEVKPVASTSKPGEIVSEKPIEQQPIKVKHGISQKVRVLTPAQVMDDEKTLQTLKHSTKIKVLTPAQVEAKKKAQLNTNQAAKVKVLTPREVEAAEKIRMKANEKARTKVET